MKILLDTNVFLKWTLGEKIPRKAERVITRGTADLLVSIITPWEIAIKQSKLRVRSFPQVRVTEALNLLGAQILPVLLKHIDVLNSLPHHHHDPFDRMLIAQAISENATVVSSDERFPRYRTAGLQVRWD